jgi:hypothetical protein
MLQALLKPLLLLTGVIIYSALFWHEKLAFNLLLFSSLLIAFALFLYRPIKLAWPLTAPIAGTLISGLIVMLYNTSLSKWVHIFSFLIMLGFVQRQQLRSTAFALMETMTNYGTLWFSNGAIVPENHTRARQVWRWIKLTLLPLAILLVFYCIYAAANPYFDKLSDKFWNRLFTDWTWGYTFFLITGVIIVAGVVFYAHQFSLARVECTQHDQLLRKRSRASLWTKGMLSLKSEYRTALILMLLLNVLLLAVNITDINYIWFDFKVPRDFSLKQFVHEGTWLLVFSIVLASFIIVYFFRGNQNFYRNNTWLRRLSYAWIVQNGILCYSVLLRNYIYVDYHGLAWKRIGMFAFLLLTFIGLITLLIKVRKVRSLYYLLRVNSWSVYAVFISMSFVNWDAVVVRYNLNHWNIWAVDTDFYLEMPGKVLPEVYARLDRVKAQIDAHKQNERPWMDITDYSRFVELLECRKKNYLDEQKKYSWRSWNWADANAKEKLEASMGITLNKVKEP